MSADERKELLLRNIKHKDVHVEGTAPGRKGYVTIASADGSVRQVPYWEAHTAYYKPGSLRPGEAPLLREQSFEIPGTIWNDTPPPKRTNQQRVESMTKRYVAEWKRGNDGLLRELLRDISVEYWKQGTPITVDALRQLAAHSLQEAENRKKRNAGRRPRSRPA
jgi:hypothetical protein